MALEAVDSGSNIYTLGPLIHNSRVRQKLEARGVRVLEEDEIPKLPLESTVIIRAHGVAPQVESELRRRNLRVLDATCPHVKESQIKAKYNAEKGFFIFLAGEKDHGEIKGLWNYASLYGKAADNDSGAAHCFVVSDPLEAETAAKRLLESNSNAKTVLIGQTTINADEYTAIGTRIRRYFPNLEVIDTICVSSGNRQEALRELCGQVEAIIIAGSRESANTRRLLSLAKELGKPSWLVETLEDIPPEIGAYETIGLSAGASAPDDLVAEIEEAITAMN
jgi:4-hydroxy-3-methylbut-2-enyl diphosphate reductase